MQNLDLIDWRLVGISSLWILGLAVVLSALGFADYCAAVHHERWRDVLGRSSYQMALNGGLALFSLGMLGSTNAWWERLLWGLLAAAFLAYGLAGLRQRLRPRRG
ncbi:MAG: hypothetical protein ABSF61_04125 [Anaerolineales bacterium]|jgi:hypothetical protein